MRLYFEEETPVVEVDEPAGETVPEGLEEETTEPPAVQEEETVPEAPEGEMIELPVPEVQEPTREPRLDSGDADVPPENPEEPSTSVGVEPRPFLTTPLEDFTVTEGLLLCIFVVVLVFQFLSFVRRH